MNRKYKKNVLAILFAAFAMTFLVTSCENAAPSEETGVTETSPSDTEKGNTETSPDTETIDPAYDFEFPGRTEKKPDSTVDEDADTLTTIVIRTAEDLLKIGNDAAYPLNGDYTLVADLDLSHIESFTPIGGSFSECGIVSGNNVFSGTFDGRGHTLVGLNISVSETERIHVGLFGSVGSSNRNDPAVIKNLILKNVTVTGPALGSATYAALMGQANGYVTVDNIALLSGKVDIDNESGDILGIGSLIGQCRTLDTTGCTNAGIHITNIFSNLTVIGDNNGRSNYTSGLIGRIRGSSIGTLSNIVQLGSVTHEEGAGHAISTGDALAVKRDNVYYAEGVGTDDNLLGREVSSAALTVGKIRLDSKVWHIEWGLPPLLNSVYNSPLFAPLDFLTLTFTGNNSLNSVKENFTLPDDILGIPVKWMSDNEKILSIEGETAVVRAPKTGLSTVTLTAYTADSAKDFRLCVVSNIKPELITDYENKVLYAKNYPANSTFTWVIDQMNNGASVDTVTETEGRLPLTDAMLNCRITLKVAGFDSLIYYYSSVPTLVITSPSSYNGVGTSSYSTGTMTLCTTEDYQKTEYDGAIEIKRRGNTTAGKPKKPFRLKLSTKADLFGMGKSKHWVLLANYNDRSNLRNKLSYDLGLSLGLAGCESTFVNVIFNGQYCGLYQLCEAIRIEEGRVDIYNWSDTAEEIANRIAAKEGLTPEEKETLTTEMKRNLAWITEGTYKEYDLSEYYDLSTLNITGGYLIENDDYYDERVKFTTENEMKLMVHEPENLYTNREMLDYIKNYIQDMEDALYAPNRLSGDGLHYTEYMDVTSFLDFFMVNHVFKNVELFYKSCYMYKDVDGPLTFGPIWDMDWAAGNHVVLDKISKAYDKWPHGQSHYREYWFKALYNDPYFMILLCERWAEIQSNLDTMMAELDEISTAIDTEAKLDFEHWGYIQKDTDTEVNDLRTWLTNRRNWMNEQMAAPETLLTSLGYYIPSDKLSISDIKDKGDCLELTVSLTDEEQIKSCEILVNGRVIGEEAVTNGTVLHIDKSLLRESGKTNSIELLAKQSNGTYCILENRSAHKGSAMVHSACFYYVSE